MSRAHLPELAGGSFRPGNLGAVDRNDTWAGASSEFGDSVRRRSGTGLVRNELRLLLTAADLLSSGTKRFHGYDLAKHLAAAEESSSIMSQPTLYRALRRLEERGALESEWESLDDAANEGREGRPRRYYRITNAGVELAKSELLAHQLRWVGGQLIPNPN